MSTLEMEVSENVGEDWEELLDQRAREIEAFKERGIPVPSWAQADVFAPQPKNNPEAQ